MKRRKDSGFAMLLVFLMAACVAIMLYVEIPRIAFEAERQHELLLIDRGNQFKRAIQVFVTDKLNNPTGRYPASVDELESFNNHRYLRRRYLDPMTGKDEWRLVHINGGVLTDSVTTQMTKGAQSGSSTPAVTDYISTQSFIGDSDSGQGRGGGVARAMGRRPSDSAVQGAPGDNSQAGGSQGMQGNANGGGSAVPIIPGTQAIYPGGQPSGSAPGLPTPGAPAAGAQQQPCTAYIGGCPPSPVVGQPGQPGGLPPQPGSPVNSQLGGGSPAYPNTPGSNGNLAGFGQPGNPMNPQAQSAAATMINNLLMTPRSTGMPSNMPGSTVGGGIAGVASKYEAEGIMVITDRTAINEWEFIFDKNKYRVPPNPISGTVGQPLSPMGPGPQPGNPPPMPPPKR